MHYHPSRPVTSPSCYIETSLSLVRGATYRPSDHPLLPCWLDGPGRGSDWEVLDSVCKSGTNKVFFADGMSLVNALALCLQELHLLHDVREVLVILAVVGDVSKKAPVIEVIDSILEDGIQGAISPEATMDPGRKGLNWFVSGVVWRGIWLNDLHLFLPFCSRVEPCNPSIVKLFDETGELLCSIIKGNSEVGEASLVFFVAWWTFCKAIVIFIHPLL